MSDKCKANHSWVYLNKDMLNGVVIAFCKHCTYTDQQYYSLAIKARDSRKGEDLAAVDLYIRKAIKEWKKGWDYERKKKKSV